MWRLNKVDIRSEAERRMWKSRGLAGGCCSNISTLPSPIQPQTLPTRSDTNIMRNQPPTSSRKIVIARHVSVIANHAFSYSCSISITRRGPYRSRCNPRMRAQTPSRTRFVNICRNQSPHSNPTHQMQIFLPSNKHCFGQCTRMLSRSWLSD